MTATTATNTPTRDPFEPLLSPFLDGELEAEEELAVRAHLAGCGRCADRLDTLRALRSAVAATRPGPSDAGLDALRRRLHGLESPARPAARRAGLWAGLAAGLALLAAGSVWVTAPWRAPAPAADEAAAPMSAAPAPGASVADAGTPCARPEECGPGAREVWPALSI